MQKRNVRKRHIPLHKELVTALASAKAQADATGTKLDRQVFVQPFLNRGADDSTLRRWIADVIGPEYRQQNPATGECKVRRGRRGPQGPMGQVEMPGVKPEPEPARPATLAELLPIRGYKRGTGELLDTVDARHLHAALKVGRDFSTWIKGRIEEYGFQEGQDFIVVDSPDRGNQSGRGGDRRSVEYYLALDMAKELAMVERTPVGRSVRLYFIACERKALQALRQAATPAVPGPIPEEHRQVQGGIVKRVVHAALDPVQERLTRIEGQLQALLGGGLTFTLTPTGHNGQADLFGRRG